MNHHKIFLISLLVTGLLASCGLMDHNEGSLTQQDLDYLHDLGILDSGEVVELFDSQAGFSGIETAGNFITDKRIAAYWIDDETRNVNSIGYRNIDSIKVVDRTRSLTYASYLEVYHSRTEKFNVYINGDSMRLQEFFNRSVEHWEEARSR